MLVDLLARLSPWRRHPSPDVIVPSDEPLREAHRRRAQAQAKRPQVEQLSRSLEIHRARNHFGENVDSIYRSRHA